MARLGSVVWFVIGIAVVALFEGGLSLLPGGRYGAISLMLAGVGTLAVGLVLIWRWAELRRVETQPFLSSRRSEYGLSALWVVTLGVALIGMSAAPGASQGDRIVYVAGIAALASMIGAGVLLFVSGRRRRRQGDTA